MVLWTPCDFFLCLLGPFSLASPCFPFPNLPVSTRRWLLSQDINSFSWKASPQFFILAVIGKRVSTTRIVGAGKTMKSYWKTNKNFKPEAWLYAGSFWMSIVYISETAFTYVFFPPLLRCFGNERPDGQIIKNSFPNYWLFRKCFHLSLNHNIANYWEMELLVSLRRYSCFLLLRHILPHIKCFLLSFIAYPLTFFSPLICHEALC